MAVDIARFLSGIESPVTRVQQGVTFGQEQADRRAAQQTAQAQAEQKRKVQAELLALSQKENRTADDFQDLIIRNPGLAKTFQTSIDQLNTEARAAAISEATNVFAALSSGNTETALKIVEDRREAAVNSGNQQEIQTAEVLIQAIKSDPKAALTSAGLFLATATGDKFADTFKAIFPKPTKQTALQERISELVATGLTKDEARRIATRRTRLVTDPITGETFTIDIATGQRIGGDAIPEPGAEPEPVVEPAPDVSEALGAGAVVKTAINKVVDLFGGELPFEETSEAAAQLSNLNNEAIQLLRAGLGGRPNVQLQRRVEKLLVEPNEIFGGEQEAKNKFQALINTIDTEASRLEGQIQAGGLRPVTVDKARQRLSELRSLSGKFTSILESQEPTQPIDFRKFLR